MDAENALSDQEASQAQAQRQKEQMLDYVKTQVALMRRDMKQASLGSSYH